MSRDKAHPPLPNCFIDPMEAYALVLVGDTKVDPSLIFSTYRAAEKFGDECGLTANGYRVVSIFIQNSGSFF